MLKLIHILIIYTYTCKDTLSNIFFFQVIYRKKSKNLVFLDKFIDLDISLTAIKNMHQFSLYVHKSCYYALNNICIYAWTKISYIHQDMILQKACYATWKIFGHVWLFNYVFLTYDFARGIWPQI